MKIIILHGGIFVHHASVGMPLGSFRSLVSSLRLHPMTRIRSLQFSKETFSFHSLCFKALNNPTQLWKKTQQQQREYNKIFVVVLILFGDNNNIKKYYCPTMDVSQDGLVTQHCKHYQDGNKLKMIHFYFVHYIWKNAFVATLAGSRRSGHSVMHPPHQESVNDW